jgi:hypothetical protein
MWGEPLANRLQEGENVMEPLTHFQEDILADLLQSLHLLTRKRRTQKQTWHGDRWWGMQIGNNQLMRSDT